MKGCTDYTEEASGWPRSRGGSSGFRLRYLLLALGALVAIAAIVYFQTLPEETFSIEAEPDTSPQPSQAEQTDLTDQDEFSTASAREMQESPEILVVYLTGAVAEPGVFELIEGNRINDAVAGAGGLREDAATDYLNLAAPIADGMHIHIPTIDEVASGEVARIEAGGAQGVQGSSGAGATTPADTSVNINTASKTELETLPGIGAAIAQRIIDFREKNGPFASIEALKGVSGIGDKKYMELKDRICV